MKTIVYIKKSILIIGVLLACVCMAYGQPYEGDYRTTTGWVHTNDVSGWQVYQNGAWTPATVPLSNYNLTNPFPHNIYANHTLYVDTDLSVNGNIYNNNSNAQITVQQGATFVLGAGKTYDLGIISVSKGAKFVNNGIVSSLSTSSKIDLASEDTTTPGGILENNGTINLSGVLAPNSGSMIISSANATIQGSGSVNTNASGTRVHIANAGGYDEAIALTGANGGGNKPQNACFTFNGDVDQVTGNLPTPICRLMVDSGHKVTLTKNLTVNGNMERSRVEVFGGSTLDTQGYEISTNAQWGNYAPFVLNSGATIITAHPNGISSVKGTGTQIGSGAIRLNSATYSSGANYIFNGTGPGGTGRQNSGYFVTSPDQDHVNNIINESQSMLLLDSRFAPLYVDGGYLGNINTQSGLGEGYVNGSTLPVEMSYFNAVFNGFNSVMLQWETQTETNNLGFYVLRGMEFEPASANVISNLIQAANTSQGATYYFVDDDLPEDGIYYYWLQDVSFSGEVTLHGPIMVSVVLGSDGNHTPELPLTTSLVRNYPNPFNPSTQLEYYLENHADVDFKVYNMRGQIVDQFMLRNQASGFHRYTWKPELSSGAYLIKFTAEGKSNTRKVVLSK